jgi:hypothetical protein
MIRTPTEKYLQTAVFALLAIVGLLQVVSCRGMYADGANMLVNILKYRDFLFFEKHRLVQAIFTQSPIVLAMWSGATSLTVLRYIYSTCLVLFPLLLWVIALTVVRKDFLFWPLLLVFVFVFYNAGFFAASESNSCIGVAAICLACFLKEGQRTGRDRTLLFVAALLLPFHYAVTLFLGPIFCVLALLKYRGEANKKIKIYWLLLAALFVVATATGLWEALAPRDPLNFAAARDPQMLWHDTRFWLTAAFGVLVGTTLLVASAGYAAVVIIACAGLVVALVLGQSEWDPFYSYGIRVYMGVAFTLCCIALIVFRKFENSLEERWQRLKFGRMSGFVAPVFVLFVVLSILDCTLSLQYKKYIDDYQSEVNAKSGIVPYEQTALQFEEGEKIFFRPWTHPVMSLVLRRDASKAIILNPAWYSGYQEFDPRQSVPDLGRYYDKR